VRDDGAVFALDSPYVLGADPGKDPTVTGGLARPLQLRGRDAEGDGAAAEVRLTDWEVAVVDRRSPGGTYVLPPGSQQWERTGPYEVVRLRPGTHIAVGQRVLTYVSPWPDPR
jgi:hypothetical protein